jgi:hypothetical protein
LSPQCLLGLISGLGYPAFDGLGSAAYVPANPGYGVAAEQGNEQNRQNNKKKHSFDHDFAISLKPTRSDNLRSL